MKTFLLMFAFAALLAAQTQTTEPAPNWKLYLKVDKLDNVPTYGLLNHSSDDPDVTLVIRCRRWLEIVVFTGGIVYSIWKQGFITEVRYKFDDGVPQEEIWPVSDTEGSLAKNQPDLFLSKLLAAKTMLFQFLPYREGSKTVTFELAALKEVMTPEMVTACGLNKPPVTAPPAKSRGHKQKPWDAAPLR